MGHVYGPYVKQRQIRSKILIEKEESKLHSFRSDVKHVCKQIIYSCIWYAHRTQSNTFSILHKLNNTNTFVLCSNTSNVKRQNIESIEKRGESRRIQLQHSIRGTASDKYLFLFQMSNESHGNRH